VNHKQSIEVFGVFRVRDKDGSDITESFTPRLRQLFLLILLRSESSDRDIQGASIDEIGSALWPHYSSMSAKNSRGVAIRELRILLERLKDVRISNRGQRYILDVENGTASEWHQFWQSCRSMSNDFTKTSPEALVLFLTLARKGTLLEKESYEWLEGLKSDTWSLVLTKCKGIIDAQMQRPYSDLALRAADVLLVWDPLSELALRVKIQGLIERGENGSAKAVLERFAIEYQRAIGRPFTKSLPQFLS